jgi:hypothetical protein
VRRRLRRFLLHLHRSDLARTPIELCKLRTDWLSARDVCVTEAAWNNKHPFTRIVSNLRLRMSRNATANLDSRRWGLNPSMINQVAVVQSNSVRALFPLVITEPI